MGNELQDAVRNHIKEVFHIDLQHAGISSIATADAMINDDGRLKILQVCTSHACFPSNPYSTHPICPSTTPLFPPSLQLPPAPRPFAAHAHADQPPLPRTPHATVMQEDNMHVIIASAWYLLKAFQQR